MKELGIDTQGMLEINKPWNAGNKWRYEMMMDIMFRNSKASYSSAPAAHDCKTLPGGNLLTLVGNGAGRAQKAEGDKWGRFCWQTIIGARDEGVIVITAYRVCQEARDNPGPYTAYTQQYTAMREQGVQKPNPRKQILTDLLALIREKRLEGYKPILMMDANGDDNYEDDIDQDLKQFIEDAHLVDHFHEKFPEPSRTYTRGKKRLDRILFDSALVGAIERIGYLGTHEGQFSDHVYAYVDFNEKKLFRGEINRPVDLYSREFLIEQTDKMVAFQKVLEKSLKLNLVKERVFNLAKSFAQTKQNVRAYQKLDA